MKHSPFTLAGLLALILAVPAAFFADLSDVSSDVSSDVALAKSEASAKSETSAKAEASAKAEPLPLARRSLGEVEYGHKDFVPTPERPVYFRQTYGDYPGATPPLKWWEGTPTIKKVTGVFGNPPQHTTVDPPKAGRLARRRMNTGEKTLWGA